VCSCAGHEHDHHTHEDDDAHLPRVREEDPGAERLDERPGGAPSLLEGAPRRHAARQLAHFIAHMRLPLQWQGSLAAGGGTAGAAAFDAVLALWWEAFAPA
jgi:hypothetical protein